MLVHQLDNLNVKTLSKLILDPHWEVLKATGYCDEASRGSPLFNPDEFWDKIQRAESKVQNLGGNQDELRLKIKQYIDGNKLLEWFPILLKKRPMTKDVMQAAQDFILVELDKGNSPSEQQIKDVLESQFDLEE
jgi:hypothetical protein